jgi:hypothetical protein
MDRDAGTVATDADQPAMDAGMVPGMVAMDEGMVPGMGLVPVDRGLGLGGAGLDMVGIALRSPMLSVQVLTCVRPLSTPSRGQDDWRAELRDPGH